MTTAVSTSTLARQLGESDAVAFTSGLLHDLGKLVLASYHGTAYGELMQTSPDGGNRLLEAEQARFDMDHAEVGGRLLTRWRLPSSVITAVRHHHHPDRAFPFDKLAAIVSLGNLIAHQLKAGEPGDNPTWKGADATTMLELSPEDVIAVFKLSRSGLERVNSLVNV